MCRSRSGRQADDVEDEQLGVGHGGVLSGSGRRRCEAVIERREAELDERRRAPTPARRRCRRPGRRRRRAVAVGQHGPGVGLDLEVVGAGGVAAEEDGQRGAQVVAARCAAAARVGVRAGTWKCTRHGARSVERSAAVEGVGEVVAATHVAGRRAGAPGAGSGPRRTPPAPRGRPGRRGRRRAAPRTAWTLTTARPAAARRGERVGRRPRSPTARWQRSRHTPSTLAVGARRAARRPRSWSR